MGLFCGPNVVTQGKIRTQTTTLIQNQTFEANWQRTFFTQLTDSEKTRLLARLNADSDAALVEKFDWVYAKQALSDHLVWGYAFLFHGFAFVLYSLSLFMVRSSDISSYKFLLLTPQLADYHCGSWLRQLEGPTVSHWLCGLLRVGPHGVFKV